MAAAPTAVSAQETNSSSTPSPTSAPTSTQNATVAVNIGPMTDVMKWSYSDGRFRIVIRSKGPTLLTVAESPGESSGGAGQIRFVRQSLSPGRNVVTVAVPMNGGAAVVILSTPGSVAQGRAAFLRADGGDELLDGPPTEDDVRDALIGTGSGTALGALVMIVRRRFALHRGMRREA